MIKIEEPELKILSINFNFEELVKKLPRSFFFKRTRALKCKQAVDQVKVEIRDVI